MDLLTGTDLVALASRPETGSTVSLFVPTHRFGNDTAVDPVRFKNLVSAVEDVLTERGTGPRAVAHLLAPARDLLADAITWQYMSEGLAVYLEPGWSHVHRVPFAVPEVATVGSRPAISPLLRATSRGDHFLILTVSHRRIRLLEATRDRAVEVELRDEIPTTLSDAIEPPEPRSDTMARSLRGGSSGPAVFYGHGAADDSFKSDETTRFFRQVANGLHEYLADQHVPMVLVGLDRATAAYREVARYPYLTAESVDHNPDQLDLEAVHAAAWPIVAQGFLDAREALAARFEALHGTGQASADPDEVAAAANEGRVETLFVAIDPWEWQDGTPASPPVVQLDQSPGDDVSRRFVRLEGTATATLSNGGEVYTVAESAVAGGGKIAATYRY